MIGFKETNIKIFSFYLIFIIDTNQVRCIC